MSEDADQKNGANHMTIVHPSSEVGISMPPKSSPQHFGHTWRQRVSRCAMRSVCSAFTAWPCSSTHESTSEASSQHLLNCVHTSCLQTLGRHSETAGCMTATSMWTCFVTGARGVHEIDRQTCMWAWVTWAARSRISRGTPANAATCTAKDGAA